MSEWNAWTSAALGTHTMYVHAHTTLHRARNLNARTSNEKKIEKKEPHAENVAFYPLVYTNG
jgi:hypothetical protein